eukprot:scaffold7214_cov152-Skeletonema_menzelii.AAC.12
MFFIQPMPRGKLLIVRMRCVSPSRDVPSANALHFSTIIPYLYFLLFTHAAHSFLFLRSPRLMLHAQRIQASERGATRLINRQGMPHRGGGNFHSLGMFTIVTLKGISGLFIVCPNSGKGFHDLTRLNLKCLTPTRRPPAQQAMT